MSYADCDRGVVTCLLRLLSAAQNACTLGFSDGDRFSATVPEGIDISDIECLTDALCVLRADELQISLLRALTYIISGRWADATQHLYSVVTTRDDCYIGKALLAFCMCYQGDPEWRPLASEVLERNGDTDSARMILALDAYISIRDGVGPFFPSAQYEKASSES